MKKLKWNRTLTILVLMMFITVTYASFNTNLFIDGKAYVRVDRDIRITNIRLLETEYNGYENTNSEYTNKTISTDVSLPKQASSVTYEVTISNVSNRRYKITDIIEDSYDNPNVKYELIDASIGNIVEPNTTKTFRVKFTNNTTIVEEDDVTKTFTYDFKYTGEVQEFKVPFDGDYTFEVWGAQGGNAVWSDHEMIGGYGGYSKGTVHLTKNTILYIYVGGAGTTSNTKGAYLPGGYNGGGKGRIRENGSEIFGSGGGATHISLVSQELQHLESYKDKIYIVAGGGGGAGIYTVDQYFNNGGSGGGIKGNSGSTGRPNSAVAGGGTQTAGGSNGSEGYKGKFGLGATHYSSNLTIEKGPGGGGGYYGGGNGCAYGASAGGGSGYIGNTNLTDKVMYCYQCTESSEITTKTISTNNHSSTPVSEYAKEGNGYARLTVSRDIEDGDEYYFDFTGGEQTFTAPYTGIYQLETWGAQGGSACLYSTERTVYGGYGGYATGKIELAANDVIYIHNGGKGGSESYLGGVEKHDDNTGYNGGGAGHQYYQDDHINSLFGGGGGASHMAFVPGKLSELESEMGTLYEDNSTYNSANIIMVAGGGGGSVVHGGFPNYSGNGGSGGGYIAGTGEQLNNTCYCYGEGGNQLNGGTGHVCEIDGHVNFITGLFGYSSQHTTFTIDKSARCGGGGGWFGGTSASHGTSGGGSGYIGNSRLYEKVMYCYNCQESQNIKTKTVSTQSHSKKPKQNQAKEGNGYSKITLVKRKVNQTKLTLDFSFEEYVNGNEYTFGFTGDEQIFTVPKTGVYKVELWGAQGGYAVGSNGGYTSGKIELNKGEKLYINVGERLLETNGTSFNGGQASAGGHPGGGATDIRLISGGNTNSVSLNSRIMVAGGGGASRGSIANQGYGGGLHGGVSYKDTAEESNWSSPATQTSSGTAVHTCSKTYPSGFGVGGSCAGGGGGYYGGSGNSDANGGGSGGSSFISGHNGCVAITSSTDRTPRNDSNGIECVDGTTDVTCSKHYSNYIFTDTVMIDGAGYSWTTERSSEYSGMPTTDGSTTMVGNTGNGFAKITCLEETTDYSFDYTGDVQEFVAPYNGIYKIELWGADGSDIENDTNYGSYTSGNISLDKNSKLYIYVGSQGSIATEGNPSPQYTEFNSGGQSSKDGGSNAYRKYGTGGGATDVRTVKGNWDNFDSLKSRIMIAGAGGGSFYASPNENILRAGGPGGGLYGYIGEGNHYYGRYGSGGSQFEGGYTLCDENTICATESGWSGLEVNKHYGIGEFGKSGNSPIKVACGGGSGFFGGGSSLHTQGAGGGSSYISGHPGCVSISESSTSNNISFVNDSNGIACNDSTSSGYNSLGYNTDSACNKHYSGYTFTNTVMIDGMGYQWDENGVSNTVVGMPSKDGRTTMVGNSGNGFARITLVEKTDTYNITYNLDGGSLKNSKKTYSEFDDDITLGTPTKEGRTFLGWIGGKNAYPSPDFDHYLYSYSIPTHEVNNDKTKIEYDNNNVYVTATSTHESWQGAVSKVITLRPKTSYILSVLIDGDGSAPRVGVYDYGTDTFVINKYVPNEKGQVNIPFTTDNTGKIKILFGMGPSTENTTLNFRNIYLEEGTELSAYEAVNDTPNKNLVIPSRSKGNRYYKAVWSSEILCKKATYLHTRACNALYESGKRCQSVGYATGDTITYGSINNGNIKSGDAFDCDVNGDGKYDSDNERFYYLTDLDSNSDYAVMIFSNYVKNGVRTVSNTYFQYYTETENWHGPLTAYTHLPSLEQWSNTSLTNASRQLYNELGTTVSADKNLEIFNYTNKAARLPTYNEIKSACNDNTSHLTDYCEYLFQDTSYDGGVSNGNWGYWLETPLSSISSRAFRIDTHWMSISSSYDVNHNNFMIKPVIEVPKSKIQ